MCTLTWSLGSEHYAVFFNRDERKQRQVAIPPRFFPEKQSIMPIDPDGKGTWIAVNQFGYSFALLNNYQADERFLKEHEDEGPYESRGGIITELIPCQSYPEIKGFIEQIVLHRYRPFVLAIFSPELIFAHQPQVVIVFWDGEQTRISQQQPPIISSAVQFESALENRTRQFQQIVGETEDISAAHSEFHRSHHPEPGPLSVCMHRNRAHTVSYSHIHVGRQVRFNYQNGSPCQNLPTISLDMDNLNSDYF